MRPDGSGNHRLRGTGVRGRTYTDVYATDPSWTPDGRLAYSVHPEIAADRPSSCRRRGARCGWIWTARPDGSDRRALVEGRDAHWSADGLTVVFTPPTGGVATLGALGARPRFLGRGYTADWSPDGTHIVYARLGTSERGDSIWLMNRDGSHPHRIMQSAQTPAWRP